jgi:hypothetical protein
MPVPTFLYAMELGSRNNKNSSKTKAAQIKFFRIVKGYNTFNKTTNGDTYKQLNIHSLIKQR